jgi:RNA polymerase sigma factor (TIGR02999 family)
MRLQHEDLSDETLVVAYNELRRMARSLRRGRNLQTLNTTALVNEAFVKLGQSKDFQSQSPDHLKHTLRRAMRFILVDAIRQKAAARRGGGDVPIVNVPFDEAIANGSAPTLDLTLAIDAALEQLAARDATQARAIELRFFWGLTDAEVATAMGMTDEAARKLLRRAKAALKRILQPKAQEPEDRG